MLTRRATLKVFATTAPALALGTLATPALAAEPMVFQRRGRAIRGADPVAYFTQGRAVDGARGLAFDWNGATWHFASEANRDAFAAAPERYAPAFGGYCAFAASRGYLAGTRPEAWTIYDGRLYLNANLDVRERWLSELPDAIAQGEANWPAILG
jgi:YHS domain-containing protein